MDKSNYYEYYNHYDDCLESSATMCLSNSQEDENEQKINKLVRSTACASSDEMDWYPVEAVTAIDVDRCLKLREIRRKEAALEQERKTCAMLIRMKREMCLPLKKRPFEDSEKSQIN